MKPIIQSLLDTDFYKFSMGQFVFRHYRDVEVVLSFTNRTKKVALAEHVREEDLRRELDQVMRLRFNNSELHYLRGTNEYGDRMFGEDYLDFLRNLQLPPYELVKMGDTYSLEFKGKWPEVMMWEIPALAAVNELYFRSLMRSMSRFEREAVRARGIEHLKAKMDLLRENPSVLFSDFGTRRRFSRLWQDYVVRSIAEELPHQFRGTSNVYLAMKYGFLPMGTSAHELFMVAAALRDSENFLAESQNEVLKQWWEMYGLGLSIALTDTFSNDFFFENVPWEMARDWKGLRHDSGDPFEFGDKAVKWYRARGIDPRNKLIVFSDQLSPALMVDLEKYFRGRIVTTFGWGTNLTNDLGFETLSLVIKPKSANGRPTVKLSDNLAKTMGDSKEIERYKQAAGYTNTTTVPCRS